MTFWLKRNGFAYKKPKPTPAKADPSIQRKFIKNYQEMYIDKKDDEVIVFFDAVHPTMSTKLSYGWIKKGTDKTIPTTASRTRINIVGSLNLDTMDLLTKSYKTIDSDAMINYWALLRKKYPDKKRIHVILDCGPYNKSIKTQEGAINHQIILHYLPPYSPNLNPIERVWKIMNEQVRNNHFFQSAQEFYNNINYFFKYRWKKISNTLFSRVNDNFQTFEKASFSF